MLPAMHVLRLLDGHGHGGELLLVGVQITSLHQHAGSQGCGCRQPPAWVVSTHTLAV